MRRKRAERDPDPEPGRALLRPVSGKRAAGHPGKSARASIHVHGILLACVALAAIFVLLQAPAFAQADGHAEDSPRSLVIDLLVVAILVIITGMFVLAETALLTIRRTRVEQLVEEGNRGARLVQQLLAEPTRMLATLQVGLTLVQLFSAGEAANRFVDPAANWLRAHTPGGPPVDPFQGVLVWLHIQAHTIAFFVIILSVGLMTLVIGEIAPKSLAIRHNERIALVVAYPIRWLQIVAKPLVWLVTALSTLLVRPFGGTATFHSAAMSEEEIKLMVEHSEEHGVIDTEEKQMIHNVFEFADTVVRRVMTPRPEMTAVEADASVDELIQVVSDSGHSRIPVYDDDKDNIVGIVHVKDVLPALSGKMPEDGIRGLMRAPYFIPENKRTDDLLAEMRRSRIQLAIVRDEYGAVSGLVTIEDLLEEIVGEIQDEYDTEEEPDVVQIDERTCVVDGRMPLEDFNDRMGAELPLEESDTLGGFVFGLMGHQPAAGERASWDGLEFTVELTDGRRIQKVRVCRESQPDESADGADADGHPTEVNESAVHERETASGV